MITPGFFSMFNAHRAMLTAQSALNTVNHNVANANTPGYSRQRVEISAFNAYASPSIYGLTGGQIGQGSMVDAVIRIRENFIDNQYRLENGLLGLNTVARDVMQQMEGILTEPSTNGVNAVMQNFFDSAQELSIHPESVAVRANFLQRAADLLNTFQQQTSQLFALRTDLVGHASLGAGSMEASQAGRTVQAINDMLNTIVIINKEIITIKASGAEPNDLLDQRDKLLDDLSELVDIDVNYLDNGQVEVRIADELMIQGALLVDTLQYTANTVGATQHDYPGYVSTVNGGVNLSDGAGAEISSGKLKSILDMGYYDSTQRNEVTVYGMINDLNDIITTLTTQVNTIHAAGRNLSGDLNVAAAQNVFVQVAALQSPAGDPVEISQWVVNPNLLNDPTLVAAAEDDAASPGDFAGPGDGRNALAMAQLREYDTDPLMNLTTFIDYFNSSVSGLGIQTRAHEDRANALQKVLTTLDLRRDSISGVNVDEEMIDMLRFQRAFEASSKLIAIFDEVIKNIINIT